MALELGGITPHLVFCLLYFNVGAEDMGLTSHAYPKNTVPTEPALGSPAHLSYHLKHIIISLQCVLSCSTEVNPLLAPMCAFNRAEYPALLYTPCSLIYKLGK